MSRNYKFYNPSGIYFISFATVYWIDVFVREDYCSLLTGNLDYCRKNKGMILYAWPRCFGVSNHVHVIFRAENENPDELIGGFKSYTSRELVRMISDNPEESRKDWLLPLMERAGNSKSNVKNRQFWQHGSHPIELWSTTVIQEKIDYIHRNPIEAGFVLNEVDCKYSSARSYMDDSGVIEIDKL